MLSKSSAPRFDEARADRVFWGCPVESAVGVVAVGRDLDENHDLALHALGAADRFGENLVRTVGDVLGRETARSAVVEDRGVLQAGVAEPAMAPGLVGPNSLVP